MYIDIHDPQADPAEVKLIKGFNCTSLLMLPLKAKGETVGLIELYGEHNDPKYRFYELPRLRALTELVALALVNARHYRKEQRARLTGETLRDRAYFPSLLEGRDVVGALVISKSTGKRSVVVASPVISDGKVTGSIGVSLDAVKLAAEIDQSIRFPPEVVFYVLDERGQTALHRAGELIFLFPSDVGSPTLGVAVKTMLAQPEGVVHYQYAGSDKTAVFERSTLTGWVFVLGKSHPRN